MASTRLAYAQEARSTSSTMSVEFDWVVINLAALCTLLWAPAWEAIAYKALFLTAAAATVAILIKLLEACVCMNAAILVRLQQLVSNRTALDMYCDHQATVLHILHEMYVHMSIYITSRLLGILPIVESTSTCRNKRGDALSVLDSKS
eukprot:2861-Heterococcus_DN1.PRE.7